MYSIRDKTGAIRNVQRYLDITESGKFDTLTKEALESFGASLGLNSLNTVDYDTFNLLYAVYLEREIRAKAGDVDLVSDFPYSIGNYGDDVRMINNYLVKALRSYSYDRTLPRGAIYTDATGAAVYRLREIFGMSLGDHIDEIFYARLKREIFAQADQN